MKKLSNRMIRVNEEIKRELSLIIRDDLKDPRIDKLVTVVKTHTTSDLKHCQAYISVLNDSAKEDTMTGLNSSIGFIRKELARRLNLRNTPEIKFVLDNSLEYSMHMDKLFKEINRSNGDE